MNYQANQPVQSNNKRNVSLGNSLLLCLIATAIAFFVLPFPRIGSPFMSSTYHIAITSMIFPLNPEGISLAWNRTFWGFNPFATYFYVSIIALFLSMFLADFFFQHAQKGKRILLLSVVAVVVWIPLHVYTTNEIYRIFDNSEDGGGEYIEPLFRRSLYDRIRLLEMVTRPGADYRGPFQLDEEEMRQKYRGRFVSAPKSFQFPKIDGYEYDPFLFETDGGDNCITIDEEVGVCFNGGQIITVFTEDQYALRVGSGYYSLLEKTDFADPAACEEGWWWWPDVLGEWDPEKCLETKQQVLNGELVTREWWKNYNNGTEYYVSRPGITSFDIPGASGNFEIIVERGALVVEGVRLGETKKSQKFTGGQYIVNHFEGFALHDGDVDIATTLPFTKFRIRELQNLQ